MSIETVWESISASINVVAAIRFIVVVAAGLLLSQVVPARLRISSLDSSRVALLQQLARYAILGGTLVWSLRELGFEPDVLLGAAGILSVAFGFASQTSASNLISGLFLIGERSFGVGDVIRIGETTGEVLSVDSLSVKLRTFDNLMVRVPNETMLKSNVTNLSAFPIRRIDMKVGIAYKEDVAQVRQVLFDVADANPFCLEEPRPILIVVGYGDSSIDLQFSAWALTENFLKVKNELHEAVKCAFDAAGIEIPFPHRSLYAGSATAPLPITLVTLPTPPHDASPVANASKDGATAATPGR